MEQHTTAYLRRKQRVLLKQLQNVKSPLLRGSLIERYKRCGNPRCHCAQGPGHGPKYYLSVSVPGSRPLMLYVPLRFKDSVEQALTSFQHTYQLLTQLAEINLELLRRREKL